MNKETKVEVGTLYDLNRNVMSKLPPQSEEHLQEQLVQIEKWFEKHYIDYHRYYMLLCKEKADYTLFKFNHQPSFRKAAQELEISIKNRGILMAINKAKEDAWEIWIKDFFTKEVHMYMLFYCGPMVIEI